MGQTSTHTFSNESDFKSVFRLLSLRTADVFPIVASLPPGETSNWSRKKPDALAGYHLLGHLFLTNNSHPPPLLVSIFSVAWIAIRTYITARYSALRILPCTNQICLASNQVVECCKKLLQKGESRSTFCNNFSQPSTWFEARQVWFVQTYTLSVPLEDFYRALFPQNLVGRGSCTVGDKRLLYTDVNIYCTVVLLMVTQYGFYCLFTGLVVSWAQMIPLVM